MGTNVDLERVRNDAMRLSPGERASLAHALILSLEESADFDLGPEREAEIQRRLRLVKEGGAQGRPADEVFADIRAKHNT